MRALVPPDHGPNDIPEPAQQTAAALRAHHEAEIKLWWPLIKSAGIKIE